VPLFGDKWSVTVAKAVVWRGILISLLIQSYVPLGPHWSVTATIDAFGFPICSGPHRPLVNNHLRSAA
jgi:hypothetical protein